MTYAQMNRLRGAQNRAAGLGFEDMLQAACVHYALLGAAAIEKTPEPMKVLKSLGKGRFEAVHEKKAQADFKGVLAGGRAVAFEAKRTAGDRIQQAVVSDTQSGWLDLHERDALMGELKGICWACKNQKPWKMSVTGDTVACEHLAARGVVAAGGRAGKNCEHWQWRGPEGSK